MIKKILLIFPLALLSFLNIFAQESKSGFFSDANGTIGNRTKVNAIGFTTQNSTDLFFETLKNKFGDPVYDEYFVVYTLSDKSWSKSSIIVRVQRSLVIELDSSRSNTVFIFAETKNKIDLLNHQRGSFKKIRQYFSDLFDKTVRNGKLDNFE